ncbi:hypothetical protein AMTRI_Chr12g238710 [Amborella trichopoda]
MLDGPLLGEEPADVKGKAVSTQNSNFDIIKAAFTNLGGLVGSPISWLVSCKSKGLNDGVVLLDGMSGDTMEGSTSLHMALSPSPKVNLHDDLPLESDREIFAVDVQQLHFSKNKESCWKPVEEKMFFGWSLIFLFLAKK